ncbi:hypothetical protein K435DRAFT_802521 [Dendrothele bispora CBS 962.96]|uniref:Uncharacterized protein n=1 Tax=Dendrothele bispora (strain CBS 962.96) TaxID=1314807 RepID=A0A4S8LLD6_DENBC|nr:hypothetical protein K435DRAFT_802521 [Dendrothele bispora CBS 962.96]
MTQIPFSHSNLTLKLSSASAPTDNYNTVITHWQEPVSPNKWHNVNQTRRPPSQQKAGSSPSNESKWISRPGQKVNHVRYIRQQKVALGNQHCKTELILQKQVEVLKKHTKTNTQQLRETIRHEDQGESDRAQPQDFESDVANTYWVYVY